MRDFSIPMGAVIPLKIHMIRIATRLQAHEKMKSHFHI
jgi:hypothetical protein